MNTEELERRFTMFRDYKFMKYDVFLIVLISILTVIGIFAIKSATINDTDLYYKKQIIGFIVGIVLMIIVSLIDYHFIAKFYWVIYGVNIALLLAVMFMGKTTNDATRWLSIGGIGVQPSEFSKVFIIIFLAMLLNKNKDKINKVWFLLATMILVLFPVVLIAKQPSLSAAIVVLVIIGVILFAAGLNYRFFLIVLIIAIPCVMIGSWYIQQPNQKLLEDYQVTRIMTFIDPESATSAEKFQTSNSIQAIGSGKLYGKGLYQGKLNQYNYLPESHTDFIYAVIGEEYGFLGCSIILILQLMIIIKCLLIAKDAKDLLGTLIIVGFATIIGFQTFCNVGVTTGLLPNTGMPLPFVSAGLSSLWGNMIAVGLILNISMQQKNKY